MLVRCKGRAGGDLARGRLDSGCSAWHGGWGVVVKERLFFFWFSSVCLFVCLCVCVCVCVCACAFVAVRPVGGVWVGEG